MVDFKPVQLFFTRQSEVQSLKHGSLTECSFKKIIMQRNNKKSHM